MWHLFQVNVDGSKTWLSQYETESLALAAQTDITIIYSIEYINLLTAEDTVFE